MDVNFDIATLMDHLVYHWLSNPRPLPATIPPTVPAPPDMPPIFPGLLFCPEDIMLLRKAIVDGWPMPTTALWRKGMVGIPKERYGKSVMRRLATAWLMSRSSTGRPTSRSLPRVMTPLTSTASIRQSSPWTSTAISISTSAPSTAALSSAAPSSASIAATSQIVY